MSLLSVSGVCRSRLRRNAWHINHFFETLHRVAYLPVAVGIWAIGLLSVGAPLPMQALIPSPPRRA